MVILRNSSSWDENNGELHLQLIYDLPIAKFKFESFYFSVPDGVVVEFSYYMKELMKRSKFGLRIGMWFRFFPYSGII